MTRAVCSAVAFVLVAGCAKFEQVDAPSDAGPDDANVRDAEAGASDADVPPGPARLAYSTSSTTGSSANPITAAHLAIPGNTPAHATIVLALDLEMSGGGEPKVTSTVGAPFVQQSNSALGSVKQWVFVADDVSGGDTLSIDVTTPSPAEFIELYAHVYTGLAANAVAVRERAVVRCQPKAVDCITTGALKAPAGAIVFGFSVSGGVQAGTGFKARETLNDNVTEDRFVTTAGEIPVTATLLAGGDAAIHGLVLVPR